ncbi:hypothetical protein DHEL01_v206330 [Diaporthe helianthi]|uniref:Uncharacterized protein n=1 Tax=Diaporthe helianthi TaxID=158607 RepID=A0A2P5HYE8_DIAHE|nr:hypothetical protein DHEL01_v206330 [Diaporthe helianthi]
MMRLAVCTATRLPRPWIGRPFTAAPAATLRYSSNTYAGNTDTLGESTLGESTLGESTSAESTSAESILGQSTSAESTLGQSTSAGSTSAGSTSTGSISAENTSADEFVKQVVGTANRPGTRNGEDKKLSSNKVRKVVVPGSVVRRVKLDSVVRKVLVPPPRPRDEEAKRLSSGTFRKVQSGGQAEEPSSIVERSPPTQSKDTKAASFLIRRHVVSSARPWKLPAKMWPAQPAAVFPRRRVLTIYKLPLETTIRDIILAIDNAARQRKVTRGEALTKDIVLKSSLGDSTTIDAVVDFRHPDGAKNFHVLARKGEFKVRGAVPEVSLDDLEHPSAVPPPSGGEEVIAQLSKIDRAEYFTLPERRKIVRRTHLMYN